MAFHTSSLYLFTAPKDDSEKVMLLTTKCSGGTALNECCNLGQLNRRKEVI